jgi:hypothetical protein
MIRSNQIVEVDVDEEKVPILPATTAVLSVIKTCWSSSVWLPVLTASFWKLTCQVGSENRLSMLGITIGGLAFVTLWKLACGLVTR